MIDIRLLNIKYLTIVSVSVVSLLVGAALAGTAAHEQLPGRWYPDVYRSPSTAGLSEAQRASVEALEALGYVTGSEPKTAQSGIVLWDRARASRGMNLYSSGHAATAILMGMDGEIQHTWSKPYREVFPDHPSKNFESTGAWRRVALRPEDGHLLAIYEGLGIVHLDADSNIVWASANRAHHDARWRPDGSVLTLTRVLHAGEGPQGTPLYEDFVTELAPDGRERRRVSVLAALKASVYADLLKRAPTDTGDLLHTNAVFPLADAQKDPAGGAGPGRVLLSMRHIDAIAVLDLNQGRLVWAGTGGFAHQHDVEISPSGRLMMFDNRGGAGGASRALSLSLWGLTPVWSWAGPASMPLLSPVLGAVQELPNGNVLVTESTRGHAVEVTRAGEVVWEFLNPNVTGPNDAFVAAIFEMIRVPEQGMDWLKRSRAGG